MHDIRIEQLPKWTSPAADGPIESEQEIRVPLKQEQVQVTK
jgi:stress response protein YsnF